MTTTLTLPSETEPSDLAIQPFDTWKAKGENLFRRLQATASSLETNRWDIGDWLIKGQSEFGEKAYETAERITGWERSSLYNIVWVVGRFPTSSLRSETGLKWSHFKELARIPNEGSREEALRRFNDGFEHSVLEVRSFVDAVLGKQHEGTGSEGKKQKSFMLFRVPLKLNYREMVESLEKEERKRLDALLSKVVVEYLEKNDKEEAKAKMGSKNPLRTKGR